jgi:hypothetical protein
MFGEKMIGNHMIGDRYRVVPYDIDEHTTFYGTCYSITQVPIYDKFIKINFEDITDQYDNTMQDKTILIHTSDSIYINNWKIMKLMNPELTQEIRRYNKCPTLANMCRNLIPYKTRIETQGTYISDVINDVVGSH